MGKKKASKRRLDEMLAHQQNRTWYLSKAADGVMIMVFASLVLFLFFVLSICGGVVEI